MSPRSKRSLRSRPSCAAGARSGAPTREADAIDYLVREGRSLTVNLGTGRGVSVLELVRAFAAASGREIPYEIVDRRAGDVAEVYADPSLANELLGWRAELGIDAMCRDAWRWQSMNPDGYGDDATGSAGDAVVPQDEPAALEAG